MKKALSVLLTAVMLLGMCSMFNIGVSAAGINYDAAKDGDVLYEVNFNGDDNYKPGVIRMSDAVMKGVTVEVKDGGKTIVATAPNPAGKAWTWGGKIAGLTVGAGKSYTLTMQAKFPSGNAGIYYNVSDYDAAADPLQDQTYNAMYGLYGKTVPAPTGCIALSRGAGGKIVGEFVSDGNRYTALPEGVDVDADGFVNVRIEVDGYFYSVWFNDKLYDQIMLEPYAYDAAPNLGFSIYLYNKDAEFTVKNVVVKKGCTYKASNSIFNESLNYDSFALGQKIMDFNFKATSGAWLPRAIANANDSFTYDISADGKSMTATVGETKGAHWIGTDINGLRITDDTKYTFTYKVKNSDSAYVGSVAYNADPINPAGAYRYNWYGSFTTGEKTMLPTVKLAADGGNFKEYGYTDPNMLCFQEIEPVVDADGYTDVVVELNGWNWTFYMKDKARDGKLVAVQTANVKELGIRDNKYNETANALAFTIYVYNTGVSLSVKDAAVYKGNTISEKYETPAVTTSAPTTTATPTTTVAPDTTPSTGNHAVVLCAMLAAVSLAGVMLGFGKKSRAK